MNPIQLADIDHIVLRVVDIDRIIEFYCDVLGCTIAKRNDTLGLIHLRAGRSLIDVVSVDGPLGQEGGAAPSLTARNLDHFCLRVSNVDLETIRAYLKTKGVATDPPASRFGADGDGLSLYLMDPESNTIELRSALPDA